MAIATVIVSICSLLSVAGLAFYSSIVGVEENYCIMTYMLQWPNFIPVPLPGGDQYETRYGLYYYSEGRDQSQLPKKVTGLPVLFIPGNAGSEKQVRSLASIAIQMKRENPGRHYDFFSIDFDEELSGLYGGVLNREREFALRCLDFIHNLYDRPSTLTPYITIIGHSMGGIIARGLFIPLRTAAINAIATIITLAAPHHPVAVLDQAMAAFYTQIDQLWPSMMEMHVGVNVVSVSVGDRDTHVRSDLSILCRRNGRQVSDAGRCLDVATNTMPNAWLSCDHKAAVWCKQVMIALARAMFDVIDAKTGLPHVSVETRTRAYAKLLRQRVPDTENKYLALNVSSLDIQQADHIRESGLKPGMRRAFMLRKPQVNKGARPQLVLLTSEPLWVALCADKTCEAQQRSILNRHIVEGPYNAWEFKGADVKYDHSDHNQKRPLYRMSYTPEEDYSYVLIVLNGDAKPPLFKSVNDVSGFLRAEWQTREESDLTLVSQWWSLGTIGANITGLGNTVLLPSLSDCVQAVDVTFIPRNCDPSWKGTNLLAVDVGSHRHLVHHSMDKTPFTVTLSACMDAGIIEPVSLQVWSSRQCQYEISASTNVFHMSWRLVSHYWALFPVAAMTWMLVCTGWQYHQFSKTGCFPTLEDVLQQALLFLPLYGLLWYYLLQSTWHSGSVVVPSPQPPPLYTTFFICFVGAGIVAVLHGAVRAVYAVVATVLSPIRRMLSHDSVERKEASNGRRLGRVLMTVTTILFLIVSEILCISFTAVVVCALSLLWMTVMPHDERQTNTTNCQQATLTYYLLALLPLCGELVTFVKNALGGHGLRMTDYHGAFNTQPIDRLLEMTIAIVHCLFVLCAIKGPSQHTPGNSYALMSIIAVCILYINGMGLAYTFRILYAGAIVSLVILLIQRQTSPRQPAPTKWD